jgi:hypothetical protein
VEVGYAGCRDDLQQTEVHVLRELMEEAVTGAQQDGHLVEDHLVDEVRFQRGGQHAAAPSTETAWALKTLLMSLLRC